MSILDTLAFWRKPAQPLPMAREEMARAVPTPAAFIAQFEGFQARPYRCPAGIPTQGYGTTRHDGRAVTLDDPPCTEAKAREWLAHDVAAAEASLRVYVGKPLTEGQRVACTSLLYNIGVGQFSRSTLLRLLNRGDYEGAADQFGAWVYGNGKVLPGLVKRRAAEAALFRGVA